MLAHNIKSTFRNFQKNPGFTSLNVIGLSIGLAVVVLILVYLQNENDYDKFNTNSERVYRVNLLFNSEGNASAMGTAPNAIGPAAKDYIPEVETEARLLKNNFGEPAFINFDNKNFIEKNFYWADKDITKIFEIKFISGNFESTFNQPNKVILSATKAKQYFGKESAIGKIISVDENTDIEVVAVFDDLPKKSSYKIDFIGSYLTTHFGKNENTWDNASFETFLILKKNTAVKSVETKLQQMLDKNVPKDDQWFALGLQPLEAIHLHSADFGGYAEDLNDYVQLKNIALLALLIVVIACINYMNLSTARSQKRMKEIVVTKTLGASFKTLFVRFYTEVGILVLGALIISILLAIILLPGFNSIIEKDISFVSLFNYKIIIYYFLMWLVVTFISGFYPAYVLASASISTSIQKVSGASTKGSTLRKVLVVSQFAVSVILIIGVITIFEQLNFVKNKKLGYQPENVLAITTTAAKTADEIEALINNLKNIPEVKSVCRMQSFPGNGSSSRSLSKDEKDEQTFPLTTNRSNAGFLDVLNLKLLAGKTLPLVKSKEDTLVEVVLNKAAVDYLGLTPDQAIGKKVTCQLGDNSCVVGVIDNFNFQSLRQPIKGYAFHNAPTEPKSFLLVKYETINTTKTIQKIEASFKSYLPYSAFDYTFLDERLRQLYAPEQRTAKVILIFSVMAIIIASLGLFGLAAYTAEQRKKEIGIRKVLGATVLNIVTILSNNFLKLVVIAIFIATPIAWWLMDNWLQSFSYRIELSAWIFIFAALMAIVIAAFTISFQSVKAAIANPVKSIGTE
jgi:putative ABC transport system permease protein